MTHLRIEFRIPTKFFTEKILLNFIHNLKLLLILDTHEGNFT